MGIDFQVGIIIFILVVSDFLSATGDSNFSMESPASQWVGLASLVLLGC